MREVRVKIFDGFVLARKAEMGEYYWWIPAGEFVVSINEIKFRTKVEFCKDYFVGIGGCDRYFRASEELERDGCVLVTVTTDDICQFVESTNRTTIFGVGSDDSFSLSSLVLHK